MHLISLKKDSSANINKAHANDAKCETDNTDSLLHNHILQVITDLLLIQKHIFISINRMHAYNENKKITAANKRINNNTKKNDMNSTTKKSNKRTNKKQ